MTKLAGRAANQGLVESYIHTGGRIGALVELNCETDFVARTNEFRTLAREIAMQVASMDPATVGSMGDDATQATRRPCSTRAISASPARPSATSCARLSARSARTSKSAASPASKWA